MVMLVTPAGTLHVPAAFTPEIQSAASAGPARATPSAEAAPICLNTRIV
jgi:hypothetical protein